MPTPLSFSSHFRTLYAYERDCNAKALQMLHSVPPESRSTEQFSRAVAKLAHLVAARHNWLFRLGLLEAPVDWFPPTTIDQLPAAIGDIEDRWTAYLANLTDEDLAADFTYTGYDGKPRRWRLLDLLTQVFGHAWYHRGQIALLVKDLGGQPIDTDYIFWNKPTILANPA
jgi:uncharacterized damage-inducible protein DinB